MDPERIELAAMVCSRVCHDVVNPVGAIINGLEVLDENSDQSLRDVALDLIRKSASQASAKLQFARLAFGAASAAGATIDLREAETVTKGIIDSNKVTIAWEAYFGAPKKDVVKLLLNLVTIGLGAIPRGGNLSVTVVEGESDPTITIRAEGRNAKLSEDVQAFLGSDGHPEVTAHNIQPFYTKLVAEAAGMAISVATPEEATVVIVASPS